MGDAPGGVEWPLPGDVGADPWELEACSVLLGTQFHNKPVAPEPCGSQAAPERQSSKSRSSCEACGSSSCIDSFKQLSAALSAEASPTSAAGVSAVKNEPGIKVLIQREAEAILRPANIPLEPTSAESLPVPSFPEMDDIEQGLPASSPPQQQPIFPTPASKRYKKSQKFPIVGGLHPEPTSSADPVSSHKARRGRHVSCFRGLKIKGLMDSLQQPHTGSHGGMSSPMAAVHQISALGKIPGSATATPSEALRIQSVKDMLVHPGWSAVVPCQASIQELFRAVESLPGANLDMPISLPSCQGHAMTTLRELMAVPASQHPRMLLNAYMRLVNANHFQQAVGDVCHAAMMSNMGIIVLLCSVFFKPAAGLRFQGRTLTKGQFSRQPGIQDPAKLKACLGLDDFHTKLARHAWTEASNALAQLQTERGDIMAEMDTSKMDASTLAAQVTDLGTSIGTSKLLGHVAKLSENAQMQLEVLRRAVRIFVWQICTPASLARLTCSCWPISPDLICCLQAAAMR
ncbi:hypothetical protein WJX74_003189 [Apatococcus lobatus]|uniref:Uncharacterized protein n=1 Tax=Apatococcus lobatus TaxID=904363 RepID=A0AAW1QZN5_9CHLO